MAKKSEKQALQVYLKYKSLYPQISIGIILFHILIRVIYYYESMFFMNWVGLIFLLGVNYYCCKTVLKMMSVGHMRTSYAFFEEVMWVNWFILFSTVLSDYFWLLYLSIPGYLAYAYVPWLLGMFFPSRPSMEVPSESEVSKKKSRKN